MKVFFLIHLCVKSLLIKIFNVPTYFSTSFELKEKNVKEKFNILWIFDKKPFYEVFGQSACVAEELFIKSVVHGRHVGQGLLLIVTQEGGGATQTA